MITETIRFLTNAINNHFRENLPDSLGMKLVMGNVSGLSQLTNAAKDAFMDDHAVISVVGVAEAAHLKNQEIAPYALDNKSSVLTPALLQLSVLFLMKHRDYEMALKCLSLIIRFFQNHPLFTAQSNPDLCPGIVQLSIEMVSVNIEQSAHLWQMIGGSYLPNVLYKVILQAK